MRFVELYNLFYENEGGFKLDYTDNIRYKTIDSVPDEKPNEDHFINYDSWANFLDDNNEIGEDELPEFIKHFGISRDIFCEGRVIKLSKQEQSYWLKKSDDIYEVWATNEEDLLDNLVNMNESEKLELIGIEEEDVYISGWECSIKDMEETGGTVYHYTDKEGIREIKKSGEIRPSFGSGISNRHAYGIFTSVDAEEYADGTYGNILIEIDLTRFLADSGLEKLNISPEPDVLEAAIDDALANKLDITDHESCVSSDMSAFTVIVNHSIPIKYLKIIN